jgi:hypothetical protein
MEKEKKNSRDELEDAFVIASFKNKERRNNPSASTRQLVPEGKQEMEESEEKQVIQPDLEKTIVIESQTPREETRRKRNKSPDYESLFLVDAGIPTRSGKLVGIREKYHKRITKIVQALGKKDVSIFSYIDNVLSHHFDTYQDEITEICNNNNDDDYFIPKK